MNVGREGAMTRNEVGRENEGVEERGEQRGVTTGGAARGRKEGRKETC